MKAEGLRLTAAERCERYADLFGYAQSTARVIRRSEHRPGSSRAMRIYSAALALLEADRPAAPAGPPHTPAHDALDALGEDWPRLASGELDGGDVMRRHPGLWHRLMTRWPMMEYADLVVAALPRRAGPRARVLEVGCGVGNTTARLVQRYGQNVTWTDREPSLVRNRTWLGTGRVFDFDREPPSDLGTFEIVVGTNALHCAANIGQTLRAFRRLLAPGGVLLIAEGSSPTRDDGTPWALDLLFSAFDGWWDRGGFRTRTEWLHEFQAHGYVDIGFTPLEAGHDDLGGLIWGTNPALRV